MARTLFFAAFVIDEESYTPEPGPVDRHFVCSDLAQSNFGEQPGVSDFIVWETIEELIAETGPSSHWNLGDDPCAACGADLRPASNRTPPDPIDLLPMRSFRDHLSSAMRNALAFEYYEARPCIERDGQITSYADEGDYTADLAVAKSRGGEFHTFWSLYGVDAGIHTAIGNFVSKDAAHAVMNAILAIPAAARNAINDGNAARRSDGQGSADAADRAAIWLDDMINQSSNGERI